MSDNMPNYVSSMILILLFLVFLSASSQAQPESTLYGLYIKALQYDEDYLTRKSEIQGAQYDSKIAQRELYPSISSNIIRSEIESLNTGPQRSVTSTGRYKTNRYQLQLSQVLYDQELFDRIQAQQYKYGALNYKLSSIKQELIKTIVKLYWQLKINYQDFFFQQEKLIYQKEKLKNSLLKYAEGQLSSEDVNFLKSEVLTQEFQLDISRSRYLSSKSELFSISLFEYKKLEINNECNSLSFPVGTSDQYLDLAVHNNNNINLYREELKVSLEEYNSSQSAYLPKLKFDAEHIESSEDGGSFDGSESRKSQAILSLTWPIYLGGKRSLQTKKTASKVAVSQTKLELYLLKMQHQIDISKHKIELSEKLIGFLQQEKKARQDRIESIKRKVIIGSATNLELSEERVNFQEFLVRQQTSCRDLTINQIELLSLIGLLNAELHLNEIL